MLGLGCTRELTSEPLPSAISLLRRLQPYYTLLQPHISDYFCDIFVFKLPNILPYKWLCK